MMNMVLWMMLLLLLLLLLLFDGGDHGDDDEVGIDDAYDSILVRYWPSVHCFVRIHGDRKSRRYGCSPSKFGLNGL